jgi:hypothetical protein
VYWFYLDLYICFGFPLARLKWCQTMPNAIDFARYCVIFGIIGWANVPSSSSKPQSVQHWCCTDPPPHLLIYTVLMPYRFFARGFVSLVVIPLTVLHPSVLLSYPSLISSLIYRFSIANTNKSKASWIYLSHLQHRMNNLSPAVWAISCHTPSSVKETTRNLSPTQ